jgi:hypothetical protein
MATNPAPAPVPDDPHVLPGAARASMEVFLVPIGVDRYELYFESAGQDGEGEVPEGVFRRYAHRFREMVAAAEHERERRRESPADPHEARGWSRRLKDRIMRWVAESIAEQRLLWNLRGRGQADLVYPSDMLESEATAICRLSLRRDADRHRFWLVVDTIGFLLSGLFMLVPGPNLIAYYFAFRLVGHYLAHRGARQGLDRVAWTAHASAPLAELRALVRVDPASRAATVEAIAGRLGLSRLRSFFDRTAIA